MVCPIEHSVPAPTAQLPARTRDAVRVVAQQLLEEGFSVDQITQGQVLERLGRGSNSTIGPALKAWKAELSEGLRAGGLPPAVTEAAWGLLRVAQESARADLASYQAQADERVAMAEAAARDAKAELEVVRTDRDTARLELADERRRRESLAEQLAASHARLEVAQQQLAAGVDRLAEAQAEVRAVRADMARARENSVVALAAEQARADAEQNRLMRLVDQARTDLNAAVSAAEVSRVSQAERIEALTGDAHAARQEAQMVREQMREQRNEAAATAANALERQRQLETALASAERAWAASDAQRQQLASQVSELEQALTALRVQLQAQVERAVIAEASIVNSDSPAKGTPVRRVRRQPK